MKLIAILNNCWRRLLLTLAVLFIPAVMAQGIVYVHAPLSSTGDLPPGAIHLPDDYLGTQVGPDFSVVINGQSLFTLSTPSVNGQPSAFVIVASALSAVIAFQPNLQNNPLDPTSFVFPLSAGQQIGSDAAGYNWLGGGLFTASIGSGVIEEPFLTIGYFTGLQSAYLGFDFQQGGQTHYGWMQVGCPISGLNVGWIYDYAYETSPNTPIFAGEVPEPSTLGLLAIGGVASLIFRKNRKNSGFGVF